MEKEKPNPRKLHKVFFLVFLCEAAANQLQQLKGCCGVSDVLGSEQQLVSHILGFMQRSKPRTGIRVSD